VIASFNYYPPDVAPFAVGGILFLLVCVFIARRIRSVLAGGGIGVVFGGLITGGVFSAGTGDMTELIWPTMAVCGAVVGGVLGVLCAATGKARKRGGNDKVDG
jgi:peptidoglycan/LPS O-acetylase OafA/YrhL